MKCEKCKREPGMLDIEGSVFGKGLCEPCLEKARRRFLDWLRPDPDTVVVKANVVVYEDSGYTVQGAVSAGVASLMSNSATWYTLTARVPIPKSVEVKADVEVQP